MRRIAFILGLTVLAFIGLSTTGSALVVDEIGASETGVESQTDSFMIEINRTYGGSEYDSIEDIVPTDDGNYLLVGYSDTTDLDGDAVIRKVSPAGEVLWKKEVGGTEYDELKTGIRTENGYLLIGTTYSTQSDASSGWAVRLTTNGKVSDEYFYGYSSTSDHLEDIVAIDGGGYMLAGYSNATNNGEDDGWLVRILSDGQKKWDFIYGGENPERFSSVAKTDSDQFVMGGEQKIEGSDSGSTHWDSYIVSTDATGEVLWTRSLGHSILNDWVLDATTTENGIAFVGQRNAVYNSTGDYYEFADAWAVTLNDNGVVLSSKTVSTTDYNRFNTITSTSDGGFLAAGYMFPDRHQDYDGLVAKFADSSDEVWNQTYGTTGTDAFGAATTTDTTGTYLVGGLTPSRVGTDTDGWLLELSSASSDDDSLPDPSTDRFGWENGHWYNETLDVDRSDGLNDSELNAVVARSMARVEKIRGLEFQDNHPVEVISRQEYINQYQSGSVSISHRLFTNIKYEAVLMINESTDAIKVQNRTFFGGVGGFYSPSSGEIKIISENTSTPKMDEITLSQELFHALQDQRYNISSYDQSTTELHNAKDGIIEGDGNYVDYLYEQRCDTDWSCLEPRESGGSDDWDPHVGIYQVFLQPYSSGPAFVRGIRQANGWGAVNEIYDNPPTSSEQTIHPEKYPSDVPTDISVSDKSNGEWHPLSVDGRPDYESFGEGGLFVTLWYPSYETDGQTEIIPRSAHFNDGSLSDLQLYLYDHYVTAGWDGDKLVPYITDESSETNETGYVYKSVWDSAADASEFRKAYKELLTHHGATPVDNQSNTYRIPDGNEFGDAFYLNRTGDTVILVNAPSVEDLSNVHSAVGSGTPDDEPTENPSQRTLSSTTISPGGEVTVTLETVASGSSVSLNEVFDPTVESATIDSVTVNGATASPFIETANQSGVVVTFSSLSPGDNITVKYTLSIPDNTTVGTTYLITGNVAQDETTALASNQLTVEEGSPLDGAAGVYDKDNNGDIDITELGAAAAAYAQDDLNIQELGQVAAIYASS